MNNIIITDDHPLLIDGIKAIISQASDLQVCATASSGKQLIQILSKQKADLLFLDINLPEIDGIEAATIIKNRYPTIKILCISTYYSSSMIEKLKAIPVDGFIPKQIDSPRVLQAVYEVLKGNNVFIKSNAEVPFQKEEPKEIMLLSEREKEVIRLIKKGLSSKEIAAKLYLSIYTIDTHRKNICAKLNLESPGALVRYAMENDLQ